MNKQMDAIEKAALKQYKLDVEAGLVQPTAEMTAALEAAEAAELAAKSAPPNTSGAASSTKPSISQPLSKATGSNSEPVTFNPVKKETAASTTPVKDETIGQPGAWETVEAPVPVASSSKSSSKRDLDGNIKNEDGSESHIVPGADDDDEGAADPEDLKGFKIVEKTYPVDGEDDGLDGAPAEGSGGSLFKKRKGGSKNTRRRM
ncbi:hypothetical protein EMPS_11144 [Entomortierella parvispora]|uniref:Uncharacterized protein n=1 Tax=Entomortierella parvispora TaxID=205924 RepID=A0A9P3HLI6_9FUNG|nr:hypothetical protein EMPS_11144 [Entomortierella parvispora]